MKNETITWTTNKRPYGNYIAHWTRLHGYRLVVSVDAGPSEDDGPSAYVVNRRGEQEASGYAVSLDEAKRAAIEVAQLLHAASSTAGRTALADVVSMLRAEVRAGQASRDILGDIRRRLAFLSRTE